MLDNKMKNQHKLCKKKLKEINDLGAQIDAKTLKFKDLTDDQKGKLARRKELQDQIAEIEAEADRLLAQEEEDRIKAEAEQKKREEEEALQALMRTPEWMAANAERLAREAREAEEKAAAEAKRLAEEAAAAEQREREEAERKAAEAAAAAEEMRLAAIRAAEDAAAEKERKIKLRKTSIKKLKEIQVLEEKMAAKGQTSDDLLPEVREKISKKAELEACIAELDKVLGPA